MPKFTTTTRAERRLVREAGRVTCCAYCGGPNPNTLDHVVSRYRGGSESGVNLVPAHRVCNEMKGAKSVQQFFALCRQIAKVGRKLWDLEPNGDARYKIKTQ